MVTGAVVGGAIGRHFGGRGGMIAGALIGSAIGGMIGYEIGHSLSPENRRIAHQKFALGMSQGKAGQKHTWTTPDQSAVANYTPNAPQSYVSQTRMLRPSIVDAPPGLDLIAASYRANGKSDIRSRPGSGGTSVGHLKKGEEIMVVGQVTGQPWYVVSRNNVTVGYVASGKLTPSANAPMSTIVTAAAPTAEPVAGSGMIASDVSVTTTSRDLNYEILKGGQKAEEGTFRGCKQADGNWLVQPQQAGQQATL